MIHGLKNTQYDSEHDYWQSSVISPVIFDSDAPDFVADREYRLLADAIPACAGSRVPMAIFIGTIAAGMTIVGPLLRRLKAGAGKVYTIHLNCPK